MAAPSRQAVTPSGVRSGDQGTLEALCARRGVAVLAYCERVCAPGRAAEGAADAFARFRAAVVNTPEVDGLDPDRLLLSVTRHAAAERAPRPAPEGLTRRLAARRGHPSPCELVPELLVARAEGELSAADLERLEHHLQRCSACRAAAERFEAAEQAYRDPPPLAIAPEVASGILAALVRAAPVTTGEAIANGAPPPLPAGEPEAAVEQATPGNAEPEPDGAEPEPAGAEPEPAGAEPMPEPPAAPAPEPLAAELATAAVDQPAEPIVAPPPLEEPHTELQAPAVVPAEAPVEAPPPTELHPLPASSAGAPAEEPNTGYIPVLGPDETYEHDVLPHEPPAPGLPEPMGDPTPPRRRRLGRAAAALIPTSGGRRQPRRTREPLPLATSPLASSGRSGHRTGRGWRLGLPSAIVGLALIVALALAGVFSGASHRSAAHPGAVPAVTPQNAPFTTPQPLPAARPGAATSPVTHRHAVRHKRKPATTSAPKRTTTARTAPVSSAPRTTPASPPSPSPSAPATPAPTQTSPSKVQAVGPSSQAAPPSGGGPASPGYQPGG